jgi:hypothetical protein
MNSKLPRIEESAFERSGLTAIYIPASVEVLCKSFFWYYKSLTSVTFGFRSKLRKVAANTFEKSLHLPPIEYPPSLSEGYWALSSSIDEDR